MKTSAEIVTWITESYKPGQDIRYSDFDQFCEIQALPWLEKQNHRMKLAKRVNTQLRRGVNFGEECGIYSSLMVNDKGNSFLLARLPQYAVYDYHRSCTSAAAIVDSVHRDMSRLLGRDGYESPVENRTIMFRGARPILSREDQMELERSYDQLDIVSPLITSLLRAANSAIKSYHRLIGPQQKSNNLQLDFDVNQTIEDQEAA